MLIILLTLSAIFFFIIILLTESIGGYSIIKTLYSEDFLSALRISLLTSTISTLISTPPALLVSYVLARSGGRIAMITESLISIPYSMTPVALGGLMLLFLTQTWIGRTLDSLFSFVFNINGIILVQSILAFSTMVTPMRAVFESIDIGYEEFSRSLGHKWFSTFINVVLPMARRGILSSVALGFLKAFSDFGATIMIAGMIIGRTATLPATIYVEIGSGNIDIAYALILILMIISLIINIFIRSIRGEVL
ncbi:MAG: ABC transporter permease subunit [Desulfurococcales archaeon]|nr:ABC transporter permease subunit [Desulfurococcales archaeon]